MDRAEGAARPQVAEDRVSSDEVAPDIARPAPSWSIAALAIAALASSACAGYTSALGFRARRAVLEQDVERFRELMEEAASTEPRGPNDNPKKTVLTHFLDLAGDERFFPFIEAWRSKGWVAEDMVCSIHRAHHRAMRALDPAGAQRSIDVCVKTAREAARDADRAWQVRDCLDEAAFLTETSTRALVPFLAIAADPTEPPRLRVALLEGMSRIPVSGPERRLDNDASLTREDAVKQAEAQLGAIERRFEWIVEAAKPFTDPTLLASGTAFGAMEIEEASIALGRSYVGRLATGEDPVLSDLAWAWVRVMKTKKKVPSLQSLGLWSRDRETKEDTYWFMCTRPATAPPPGSPAAAVGVAGGIDAISIRTSTPGVDREALRTTRCVDKPGAPPYPRILGPFPLESVGRGMAAASRGGEDPAKPSARTSVILRRRLLL